MEHWDTAALYYKIRVVSSSVRLGQIQVSISKIVLVSCVGKYTSTVVKKRKQMEEKRLKDLLLLAFFMELHAAFVGKGVKKYIWVAENRKLL